MHSAPFFVGQLYRTALQVGVSPTKIGVEISLGELSVDDLSEGCGSYSSVLSTDHSSTTLADSSSWFMKASISVFTSKDAPSYPGYRLAFYAALRAPSLVLRARWVDELTNFVVSGPLGEIQRELKEMQKPSPPSLLSSLYASAIQIGKDLIQDKSVVQDYFSMPLMSIQIDNFVVLLPESSTSSNHAVFELGNVQIVNDQTSLSSVKLSIQNMQAATVFSSSLSQALMGGMSCQLQIEVGSTIQCVGAVSRLAIAINQQQLEFFARLAHGNLKEKAMLCKGEYLLVEPSTHPSDSDLVSQLLHMTQCLSIAVTLEGLSLECLQGDEGYAASTSGQDMYHSVGRLSVSICLMECCVEFVFVCRHAANRLALAVLTFVSFTGSFAGNVRNPRLNPHFLRL